MFLSTMSRAALLAIVATAGCGDEPAATQPSTPPTTSISASGEIADNLRRHVGVLAGEIGERNHRNRDAYDRAAQYIVDQLTAMRFTPVRHEFAAEGQTFANFAAEIAGGAKAGDIILIGAHYDSANGTPGANDNASGAAAALELARLMRDARPARTIRFVFFANEEPPHFQRPTMGSLAYARRSFEAKENIVAMISLETIGYFSDVPGSQRYPEPLAERYPDVGNFIGVVSDLDRREFVERFAALMKRHAKIPVESAALPPLLPGVGWSDHWAFWQFRYPALMITDTAPFRYPHYHKPTDTPDKLDYARMAAVVEGVWKVVDELSRE